MSKSKFVDVALATKTTAVVARAMTLAKAVAGVATKFVAMAKFTDFATNVATLARFATAKAVAIRSVKLATMAILATFATATLMGCDEAKSLVASVSIEEPLVEIAYSNGFSYLSIQSQDNETIIEDVIINRGNCEKEFSYKSSSSQYKTKEDCIHRDGEAACQPIYPSKLPYGNKFRVWAECSVDTIIEVELVVNGGGRLTYSFK